MNERIKEIAKQAYEDVIENTPSFLVTKELYEQKFAELIVRECMELVQGVPTDTMGYHTADQKIKQHFGVEE